jgi:hypothetical protein
MAIITALFCKLRHDHAYDILVFIEAKLEDFFLKPNIHIKIFIVHQLPFREDPASAGEGPPLLRTFIW